MSRVQRILVPTDFSLTSTLAFDRALDMAAREGASIDLVHVLDDVMLAGYPNGLYVEVPELRAHLVANARERLADAAKSCAAANIPVTAQVLVGPAATSITRAAQELGTDLIVMGTHGRTAFAHLMLGSVAERVLRTAPCPVLTVRDTPRTADAVAAEGASWRQAAGA